MSSIVAPFLSSSTSANGEDRSEKRSSRRVQRCIARRAVIVWSRNGSRKSVFRVVAHRRRAAHGTSDSSVRMIESHGGCYRSRCRRHCAHPLSRLSHSGDELVTSTTLILTSTRERPCSARVGGRRRRPTRRTIAAAMVRDDAHDVRGQRRADEHGLRSHLRRVLRYETCSCWQSCAWGVIFGSTPRRSRRRSPAGRRRRRRP